MEGSFPLVQNFVEVCAAGNTVGMRRCRHSPVARVLHSVSFPHRRTLNVKVRKCVSYAWENGFYEVSEGLSVFGRVEVLDARLVLPQLLFVHGVCFLFLHSPLQRTPLILCAK